MFRFIARRVLQTIPVLLVVATMTFFMLRLAPGGPFTGEKNVPQEILDRMNAHYGLGDPMLEQYGRQIWNLMQGDLGPSYRYINRSVNEIIGEAFPVSLELGVCGLFTALFLGVAAGLIASLRPNTATDYVPMSLAMVGICLPTFVMGPILLLIFALKLEWVNVGGWEVWQDRILPSLTLGFYYAAYVARLSRGGMLEMLNQDFIRTARAKGASTLRIVFRHALRGGLLPVISFIGPATAGLIAGSFVVETIFQIPGLGRHFVTAAFNRDYTLVTGLVVFFAALVVASNLVVDIVQVWLNPKLRFE